MTKPRVWAISGKRFSGKDTLAALLVRKLNERNLVARRFALADACKEGFVAEQKTLGIEIDLPRLMTERSYKELWRNKLTEYTEKVLSQDPTLFVKAVVEQARIVDIAILSDLRLMAELNYLQENTECKLIRINRSDDSRRQSGWCFDRDKDLHRTECELDLFRAWDCKIDNNTSIKELEQKVLQCDW